MIFSVQNMRDFFLSKPPKFAPKNFKVLEGLRPCFRSYELVGGGKGLMFLSLRIKGESSWTITPGVLWFHPKLPWHSRNPGTKYLAKKCREVPFFVLGLCMICLFQVFFFQIHTKLHVTTVKTVKPLVKSFALELLPSGLAIFHWTATIWRLEALVIGWGSEFWKTCLFNIFLCNFGVQQ